MRRKMFEMFVLFAVLMVFAGLSLIQAQGQTVGVSVGNYFEYKVNSAASSSTLYGVNHFTETVTGVNGPQINCNEVLYLSNGGSVASSGYENLETGSTSGTPRAIQEVFYTANLQVGDSIEAGLPIFVNETTSINGRQTNHATGIFMNMNFDAYMDQATGITVNVSVTPTATGQPELSGSYTLIGTNVWNVIPEFSPIALILAMLLLTASAATIVSRRKK